MTDFQYDLEPGRVESEDFQEWIERLWRQTSFPSQAKLRMSWSPHTIVCLLWNEAGDLLYSLQQKQLLQLG